MANDIISKTMELIKTKYSVSDDIAWKYAEKALDSLESHGGTRTDFSSVIKVVEVVVKDWLENERFI